MSRRDVLRLVLRVDWFDIAAVAASAVSMFALAMVAIVLVRGA